MSKLRVDKIAAPIVQDEFTGSVHFDGTTQNRITIPSTDDFAPGTGDFTIEMWVYHTDLTGQQTYFGDTYGNTSGIYTYKTSNNEISLYDSAQRSLSAQNVIKLNTWHHIAWTRENGVLRAFLDGVIVDEDTYTGSFTDTDYFIGDTAGTSSGEMIGYISNLRYCKNHAVYNSNFTVPTRELVVHKAAPKGVVFSAADNVTTLLACQSATDATLDASGRHTLTASSGVTAADANPGLFRRTLNLTTVTENTGSVFFDGTGDYLKIGASTDFSFAGDFTIEFWVNTSTFSVDSFFRRIVSNGADAATSIQLLFYDGSGATSNLSVYSNAMLITGDIAVATGDWVHVALSRSGTSMKLFVNGAQSGSTATTSQNFSSGASSGLIIGKYAGGNSGHLNGYVSNLRICQGHAVYTSQFIPPTRELEVHGGPEDNRTTLLCCHDGENIFADKSGRHVIMAYGDRTSSPTPTATDSPIGITTHNPGLTRNVDPVDGPTFQGGAGYTSQNWLTLPKGTTTDRMSVFGGVNATSARGVFGGGYSTSDIEYIQISTLGNSSEFGDRAHANQARPASLSSSTRGLFAGGFTPNTYSNTIDYITITTTGNGKDFGDMTDALWSRAGCSNSIRGIIAGGSDGSNSSIIEHLIISSTGNGHDFGDLTRARRELGGSSSTTRGIFMGGRSPVPSGQDNDENIIDYITIATTGNAVDFGDLTVGARTAGASCSNATRSLYSGGNSSNTIEFVTIATLGNSTNFGDMNNALNRLGSCASSTRGIIAGGSPTNNTIEYVTISTESGAIDFGDLNAGAKRDIAGLSNGHGGLG